MMILKGRRVTNNKWETIRKFDNMEMNEIIRGLYSLQCGIERDNMYRIDNRFSEYKVVLENGKEINSSMVYIILTNY